MSELKRIQVGNFIYTNKVVMMWDFHEETTQKARKDYRCDACLTIMDTGRK